MSELAGRWQPKMVLKRDVFSTIERGEFLGPGGPVDAVMRRIDEVPWWAWLIARHFLWREARALEVAGPLGVGPPLLHRGKRCIIRGFLHGVALHVARPVGEVGYFRSARKALRTLHRAGICHNDLAKEQNWLRSPNGEAYMTDFQLAVRLRRGSWLHRIAAYEDLRHLLKHKRRYVPDTLTPTERRIIARKGAVPRVWEATGKRIYWRITRGLGIEDREGGGTRTNRDVPEVLAQIRQHPGVRDAAIILLQRQAGVIWMYAFVEASGIDEEALHADLQRNVGLDAAPEIIQIVDQLPRNPNGDVRTDILHLIPYNQVVDLDRMDLGAEDRRIAAALLAGRKEFGYGPRHSKDAPMLAARLRQHPRVREALVLSFPHQRIITGLYAFIEGDDVREDELRDFLAADAGGRKAPELIQVVAALPRDERDAVRRDLLQDIAMNELDRLGAFKGSEREEKVVAELLAGRKIVRDL